jgi:hypothetical protein
MAPPPLAPLTPPPPPPAPPQELLVLDIFCGAGGLSFLEQRAAKPSTRAVLAAHGEAASVGIYSRWAVDLNRSAIATYEANHGGAIDVRGRAGGGTAASCWRQGGGASAARGRRPRQRRRGRGR